MLTSAWRVNRMFIFLEFASYRLNLGVKKIIKEYQDIVDGIQRVMLFLRTIKARAALRQHTILSPVVANVTRWSSTSRMVKRYLQLLPYVSDIAPADIQLVLCDNAV